MVFAASYPARHSQNTRNPFHAGAHFRGFTRLQLLRPFSLLASPRRIRLGYDPATGGFYVQSFDGAVTLPDAGYDYDIDWTPMSAGLAPAGMAASFAALGWVEPCETHPLYKMQSMCIAPLHPSYALQSAAGCCPHGNPLNGQSTDQSGHAALRGAGML